MDICPPRVPATVARAGFVLITALLTADARLGNQVDRLIEERIGPYVRDSGWLWVSGGRLWSSSSL